MLLCFVSPAAILKCSCRPVGPIFIDKLLAGNFVAANFMQNQAPKIQKNHPAKDAAAWYHLN